MKKRILVLNCGSSSVKYALFDRNEKEHIRGIVERIGTKVKDHKTAIKNILNKLIQKNYLSSLQDIAAVGHRVVHGGDITKSVVVTKSVMNAIKKAATLAPLHNPHNIEGIKAIQHLLPTIPNIAVFDTAFHTTIPAYAATYALPFALSKKYNIKRYGFHGISYQYICEELKKKYGKLPSRLLVCHLGNGSSICAIKNGKSVDTSMGFTPLEGLMMGTRCGDIDPGVIFHIARMRKECRDMDEILNFKSGLKGIANRNDMRDIWKRAKRNSLAKLALHMYCYRLQKYIGAYTGVLGGIDALVFTAGIGEHAWYVRERVCTDLRYLEIFLDHGRNKENKEIISQGRTKVYVLHTNEERMIAREVQRLLS